MRHHLVRGVTVLSLLVVLTVCKDEETHTSLEEDTEAMALMTRSWIATTDDGEVTLDLEEDTEAAGYADTCTMVAHVVWGEERGVEETIGGTSVGCGGCYGDDVLGYVHGTISGGAFGDGEPVVGEFYLAMEEVDYDGLYDFPYTVQLRVGDPSVALTGELVDEQTLSLRGAGYELDLCVGALGS